MKRAEELKKATSTDSSKDLNRSSSGSLSLESDLVGSDSQDEKSSVSTRSSMGYDPATGMPIFDDEDEQAAKLLDEAIEADKADYIEAQKTYQTQLEAIWDKFRMPFSQRLDMAVKYGKKQDNRPLLEKASV